MATLGNCGAEGAAVRTAAMADKRWRRFVAGGLRVDVDEKLSW